MAQGKVKWFNATKGYGFIAPDDGGRDVLVHITAVLRAGLRGLNDGDALTYEVAMEHGKAAAVNLTLLGDYARPAPMVAAKAPVAVNAVLPAAPVRPSAPVHVSYRPVSPLGRLKQALRPAA